MFNLGRENTGLIAKWWRNIDKQILFLFILFFFLGLFFSFSSTSSVVAEKFDKETYFFFIKHLIFVILSLLLLFIISIQEKNKIIKYFPYFFFISFILLLLVPFIGTEIKGSKRWLDLFIIPKFQPIELVKPLFILYVAKIIILNSNMNIYSRYLLSFFILFFISVLLINQPDLGQTLLLLGSWLIMIFVSGFNMYFLTILGFVVLFTIFFFSLFFSIKIWLRYFKGSKFS